MTDTAKMLLETSIGTELSPEEAAVLGGLMTSRELADGEYLIEEGAADDLLHVLLRGKLEVVKHTGADEESSLAILREGDLAGELSFIDGNAHSVGLRALTDCLVVSLKRAAFEGVVDNHARLAYKVMRAIARSSHQIVRRMNSEFIELSNYIFKQHGRY